MVVGRYSAARAITAAAAVVVGAAAIEIRIATAEATIVEAGVHAPCTNFG